MELLANMLFHKQLTTMSNKTVAVHKKTGTKYNRCYKSTQKGYYRVSTKNTKGYSTWLVKSRDVKTVN